MDNISLQSFSSILEILAVYYIGTATSEKLKDLFGINETLGKSLIDNEIFGIVESLRKANDHDGNSWKTRERAQQSVDLAKTQLKWVHTKGIRYNYLDTNNLFNCFRPFYIYFGIFSFGLLFLGGIIKEWHHAYSLVLLNMVATLLILALIYNVFNRIGDAYIHWGSIKSLVLSVFVVVILLSVPENIGTKYFQNFMPVYAFNNTYTQTNYLDFHVITALILLLLPLGIHILCLIYLMYNIVDLKKLFVKCVFFQSIQDSQADIKKDKGGFFKDIPDIG